MENSDQPAFVVPLENITQSNQLQSEWCNGLTKREYAAIMAMQGILAAQTNTGYRDPKDVAERAVKQADELLKQLEKDGK